MLEHEKLVMGIYVRGRWVYPDNSAKGWAVRIIGNNPQLVKRLTEITGRVKLPLPVTDTLKRQYRPYKAVI